MNIEFEDEALEELFITGTTEIKRYKRLPVDIIKRYIKVVNYLRAAGRIEDLYVIKSLHYEKKSGNLKNEEVVWINDKYRLHFRSSPDFRGVIINALLTEISKHYE